MKVYEQYKKIENELNKTNYTLKDYNNILNKMGDEKSKNILYYRLMVDNAIDPYYGLMLQKTAIEGDSFNDPSDKIMYSLLTFLLKNNNYKKKIYIIGFSKYNVIPNSVTWQSSKPLDIDCIFDDINTENEYTHDATGGKYIDVISLNRLNEITFDENSIFIIANPNYQNYYEVLKREYNINEENIFLFYCDALSERNIQYFGESFIPIGNDEILIDGGAFNLYSAFDFSRWTYGRYKKIYSFEAIESLYDICKKNIDNYNLKDIELFNLGLWSENTKIKFDYMGSASRASECGRIIVNTDTIDNILDGKEVTIIKLDIEGAEYEALIGAEKTIKKYKPTLMICAYHNPNDIIKLTNLIISYNPNYKIYARHYGYSVYETVLYFIDNNK